MTNRRNPSDTVQTRSTHTNTLYHSPCSHRAQAPDTSKYSSYSQPSPPSVSGSSTRTSSRAACCCCWCCRFSVHGEPSHRMWERALLKAEISFHFLNDPLRKFRKFGFLSVAHQWETTALDTPCREQRPLRTSTNHRENTHQLSYRTAVSEFRRPSRQRQRQRQRRFRLAGEFRLPVGLSR